MNSVQEQLVINNMNLVFYMLNKMNLFDMKDDYYDIGIIGLVKASKSYDTNKGFTFPTYACKCIKIEILNYIRTQNTNKTRTNKNTISLENTIYKNNNFDELRLKDVLKSDVNIENDIIYNETIRSVYKAISKLSLKEQYIIKSYFGICSHKKLKQGELALKYKISQSQICRIKNSAIKKIREMIIKEDI